MEGTTLDSVIHEKRNNASFLESHKKLKKMGQIQR